MNAPTDVGHAIAAAARTINRAQDLDETLQTVVEVGRDSVPGFDQVGIWTLQKNGDVQTRAATGDLVYRLDDVQYDLDEGPCMDALRGAHVVTAPRIRHDQRWPRFVPQAVAHGLRSQLAVRLFLDDEETMGGINFYSTTVEEVHPDAEALADLVAAHAAFAFLVRASSHSNIKLRTIAQELVDQANAR